MPTISYFRFPVEFLSFFSGFPRCDSQKIDLKLIQFHWHHPWFSAFHLAYFCFHFLISLISWCLLTLTYRFTFSIILLKVDEFGQALLLKPSQQFHPKYFDLVPDPLCRRRIFSSLKLQYLGHWFICSIARSTYSFYVIWTYPQLRPFLSSKFEWNLTNFWPFRHAFSKELNYNVYLPLIFPSASDSIVWYYSICLCLSTSCD